MKKYIFYFNLFILSSISILGYAQQSFEVQGKIVDAEGQALPGVTLSLKEVAQKALSDDEGRFKFNLPKAGLYKFKISHIGYITAHKALMVQSQENTNLVWTLLADETSLAEVNINEYKSLNKKVLSIGKGGIASLDLPQSTEVIGAKFIEEQQIAKLSDVVKNFNGVYIGTTRGSTQETVFARGYNLAANNIFKNGARMNSGSMPEMSSLEQVEVLKGSAAILYGNVAAGGIVNLVTKKPKFEHGGSVAFRADNYSSYKPTVDIYGPLNDQLAYRLNVAYDNSGSFRNEVQSKRYYVNPSVLYKINDKSSLLVQGDYLYHHFTPDFGFGTVDSKIMNYDRSTFFGASWQYAKTQQASSSAEYTYNINSDWKFYTIASYQFYKRDYYSTERIQAAANGDWTRPLGKSLSTENYYALQANVNGKFNTGKISHNLLAGIDADRIYASTEAFNNPTVYDKINVLDLGMFAQRTDIPAADAVKLTSNPTNRLGLYVQDLLALTPQLKALVGMRFTVQRALPNIVDDYVKNTITRAGGQTDRAWTPRVGLVYQPIKTMAIFASYANSFTTNTGTDIYGNGLAPSYINQYELGIKNDFLQGLLSVNLTAYQIVNSNLAQMAEFNAEGLPNTLNTIKVLTGQTTSKGFELDIIGRPVKGLSLMAGYSYNDMRYSKTAQLPSSFVEGQRLVSTPAHTGNLSAYYKWHIDKIHTLDIGAAANYVGKRNAGWNNTYANQQNNLNRLILISDYTTVDFNLGYSYKAFSILAKVANVGNTYNYYVHENYSVNPIAPRQYISTIQYRF